MTVSWPADLPSCLPVDEIGTAFEDARLVGQMEFGPSKVRRRGAATRPLSARLRCDVNKLSRLQRFWTEETQGGVLPFLIKDPMYDGRRIGDEDGEELSDEDDAVLIVQAWLLVQFQPGQTPNIIKVGSKHFRVSFSLIVLP